MTVGEFRRWLAEASDDFKIVVEMPDDAHGINDVRVDLAGKLVVIEPEVDD